MANRSRRRSRKLQRKKFQTLELQRVTKSEEKIEEKVEDCQAVVPDLSTQRIAFVNPPSPDGKIYIRDINRSGRLSVEGTIWPQTSLAMLASVFSEDEVTILDCIALKLSYKQLYAKLEHFKPTWVVFNPISSTFTHDMIVAHYGKSLGAKTVSISPHTKVFKEECLERFPALDYTIDFNKGSVEPEFALRELIKGIPSEGCRFEDLGPARQDLLPIGEYNLPFIGEGYTFVVTNRGCPWKCIYCRQGVMYENEVRYRPVDVVIDEIKKYNLKNIALHADTATMNRGWMDEFCRAITNNNLDIRWICNSRVDTVDVERLKMMKDAGCWLIAFGCESGDDNVLELNKKEVSVERCRQAVHTAKRAGLQVWGYFMLGLYGDNKSTMDRTIDLAIELPFDIVNFAIAAPYPGTEWGAIAERNGWLVDGRWESYDQNYSAQVSQPDCSVSLVKEYQRKAYRKWFFSWRGIKFLFKGLRPRYFKYFMDTIKAHREL